jgi:hypothetical protein
MRTQSSVCATPAVSCALMRRPSGERHRKSVTKADRRAIPRKHPRARAFQALLGDDRLVHAAPNSACGTPFGHDDARDVDRRARPETDVTRHARQTLPLHEQTRAHLDGRRRRRKS